MPLYAMPAPIAHELTDPRDGYYSTRFVKGGPMVPIKVQIVTDASDPDVWILQAIIDGKALDYAYTKEEVKAEVMIWLTDARTREERTPAQRRLMHVLMAACREPISHAEYERLVDLRHTTPAWHPCHRPYEAIDLSKLPALGRVPRNT